MVEWVGAWTNQQRNTCIWLEGTSQQISTMVPVNVPPMIFKQLNQLIRDFLRDGKKPWMNICKLRTTRNLGGLAFPNVGLYGISLELAKLAKHWNKGNNEYGRRWKIDRKLAAPFGPILALSHKSVPNMNTNGAFQRHMDKSSQAVTYSSIWGGIFFYLEQSINSNIYIYNIIICIGRTFYNPFKSLKMILAQQIRGDIYTLRAA